ncbi:MAG: hypothetical protein OXG37_12845 [Actinomycetia bacterium]|nr:hypothetical protein [Actinomycetes bacterium]
MTADELPRPSFYALAPGSWRDYVTLLHLPYTAWHLSYVVIGAALAPALHADRLGATLLAFFLAVGIGAHALDELNGRPLQTRIPARLLVGLAAASIAAAVGIGAAAAVTVTAWLGLFVGFGAFIVVAYNLELVGGWFHRNLWFALAWGGFPLLCSYFALTQTIRPAAVLAAVFATGLSLAQRRLSTQVRHVRRRIAKVEGVLEHHDGACEPITAETLRAPAERALELLAVSVVVLACALVIVRVT